MSYFVSVTGEQIVEGVSVVGDTFGDFRLSHQAQEFSRSLIVESILCGLLVLLVNVFFVCAVMTQHV